MAYCTYVQCSILHLHTTSGGQLNANGLWYMYMCLIVSFFNPLLSSCSVPPPSLLNLGCNCLISGTPALTSRGMKEKDIVLVGEFIHQALEVALQAKAEHDASVSKPTVKVCVCVCVGSPRGV